MTDKYLKDLKTGYFIDSEKKAIKEKFIIGYPAELATEFAAEKQPLSTKQARSILNNINACHVALSLGRKSFDEVRNDLCMLYEILVDRDNKGTIPRAYRDFYKYNLDQVHDAASLKAFLRHHEALCCNLKESKGNNGNNYNSYSNNSYNNNNSRPYNKNNRY